MTRSGTKRQKQNVRKPAETSQLVPADNSLAQTSEGRTTRSGSKRQRQNLHEPAETSQLVPADDILAQTSENSSLASSASAQQPLIPAVDISGGDFSRANLGPQTNKQILKVDKRTIHNYYYLDQKGISTDQDVASEVQQQPIQREAGKNQDTHELSPSVCIFKSKLLSHSPTSQVYEGEIISAVQTRQVAVKLMEYSEKNCREAKILLRLQPHTNVAAIILTDVYDSGLMKHMYIVMDKCSTLNMEKYIENRIFEGVPFNFTLFFEYSRQVIDAIEHIHKNGIIHRDLKPSSLLFSLCGKCLKIADFGLSKELKSGRSVMSVSKLKIGTDGYRAPETYNKNELSKKADIFSLGLVLHYLWGYGLHPFGKDPEIWNYNIKNECKDLDLSGLLIPNPHNAQALLESMLKFPPAQRPSIDEVKDHAAFSRDMEGTVIDSMNLIWEGHIKGAEDFSCRLLQMKSSPDIGLDRTGLNFRLKNVPHIGSVSLKNIVKGAPSGYIATWSKEEIQRQTKTFISNKEMGWVSITSEGKPEKVLILTHSPEYEELFGVFVHDPSDFTAWIQDLVNNQQQDRERATLDEEEAAQASEKSIDEATKSTEEQELSQTEKASQTAKQSTPTQEGTDEANQEEQNQEKQDRGAKPNREYTCRTPELIPWWFFQSDRTK